MEFDITRIANLSQLKLTKKEKAQFSSQLKEILAYVEKITKLEIRDVPPTFQTAGIKDAKREDVIDSKQSLSQEEALANASGRKDGFFKIKPLR